MDAVVIDAGTKMLKSGFAVPDQPPSMVTSISPHLFSSDVRCQGLTSALRSIAQSTLHFAMAPL